MLTMTDINTIKNLRNNHDKSINEIANTLDLICQIKLDKTASSK